MAAVSGSKICLFWVRYHKPTLGGLAPQFWNGDPTANPDTLTGGINFGAGKVLDGPLYLTVTGTGDAGVTVTTVGPYALQGGFGPYTYTPGWIDPIGGDPLDPATIQGSTVINGSPGAVTSVSFPAVPGSIQGSKGAKFGRYYFEYQNNYDIFSNAAGCGPMRLGAQLAYLPSGAFSVSDNDGGAMANGGDIATSWGLNAYANGVNFQPPAPVPAPGTALNPQFGVAVAIIAKANFIPSLFSAVRLPAVPCCSFRGRPLY